MTDRQCHYGCGETDDLRPYGPGGAWVCFDCAMATPEREREAESAFGVLMDAAGAGTGVVVIGLEDGPAAVTDSELLHLIYQAADAEVEGERP